MCCGWGHVTHSRRLRRGRRHCGDNSLEDRNHPFCVHTVSDTDHRGAVVGIDSGRDNIESSRRRRFDSAISGNTECNLGTRWLDGNGRNLGRVGVDIACRVGGERRAAAIISGKRVAVGDMNDTVGEDPLVGWLDIRVGVGDTNVGEGGLVAGQFAGQQLRDAFAVTEPILYHICLRAGQPEIGSCLSTLRLPPLAQRTNYYTAAVLLPDMTEIRVSDVMTTPMLTLTAATPIDEAARAMGEADIKSVVIVEAGCRPDGIFTSTDALAVLADAASAAEATVGAYMTAPVETVSPTTALTDAAKLMGEYSHLPVTDSDGDAIGILTKTDLAAAVADAETELADTTTA